MKKSILIIMLAAVTFSATAQDTLMLTGPKNNYHYDYWPISAGDSIYMSGYAGGGAFYHYTQDSLIIYGIVAGLISSESGWDSYLDKIAAVLRVYKRTPSNAVYRLGDDLPVSLADSPTYYMKMDAFLMISYMNYQHYPVFPIYERYYATPVAVTDSFYVGFDQQDRFATDNYQIPNACVLHFKRCNESTTIFNVPHMFYCGGYWEGSTYVNGGWQGDSNGAHFSWPRTHFAYPYIFPILTPAPDTTVISSDTTAMGDTLIVCDTTIIGGDTIVNYDTILTVGQADLLQRLTGVMPNPAAEKARVVSSFGMSMVKVYNASGALVHTQRADGLYVDLDVSRWPAGTYLVRIHTPQGIATKRLVVGR